MSHLGRILIVEDDPRDVELTLTALEEYKLTNEVVIARDGAEALDYLYRRGPVLRPRRRQPRRMLLDLKLPKIDGSGSAPKDQDRREATSHPGRGAHVLA